MTNTLNLSEKITKPILHPLFSRVIGKNIQKGLPDALRKRVMQAERSP